MANILTAVDNSTYEVLEKKDKLGKMIPYKLGAGGQGAAFKVKSIATNGECVAKLYHTETPPEFNKNLQTLTQQPSPHEAFVWPQKLLKPRSNGAIGFIMDLYDNKVYKAFPDVAIYGKASFASRQVMLNALIELVSAFEALHAAGLCFQDLNEGAVVFDVEKGRVRICDCENVVPTGVRIPMGYNAKGHAEYMRGCLGYRAPEIEIGAMYPDKYTDRYSLAVMIFMVLTRCHPLEGKKRFSFNPEGVVDANVEKDIYGKNPIFVYDDTNMTNRPDPEADQGAIAQWPLIPDFIKDLFKKAFCQGLPVNGVYDETKKIERCNRPAEKQWREAFAKWMDLLVPCAKCHVAFTAGLEPQTLKLISVCPNCKNNNRYDYPRVKIIKRNSHRRTLLLIPERTIPISAISDSNAFDPAILVLKAKRPGIHGVKNVGKNTWNCYLGKNFAVLKPGDFVKVENGMRIAFDNDYYGEIVL